MSIPKGWGLLGLLSGFLGILGVVVPLGAAPLHYFCPYEVVDDPDGGWFRQLSINRLTAQLRGDLGLSGLDTPWDYEDEVAGVSPTAPNRGHVVLTDALPPGTLQQVVAAPQAGGAGCEVMPPGQPRIPARAPVLVEGVLTYDRLDPTRTLINPNRDTSSSLLTRYARRLLPSFAPLWHGFVWSASTAYALGTFPDPGTITDAFTRANETPLGAPWVRINTASGQNAFNLTTNVLACPVVECGMYYSTVQGPAAMDAFVSVPDESGTSGVGVRGKEPGLNTHDGFMQRNVPSAAAQRVFRFDNGVQTQLLGDLAGQAGNGGRFGLRADGTTLTAYLDNGSGWTSLGTRDTGGTYPDGGYAWLWINNINGRLDDFGFTPAAAAAAGKRSLGLLFLR